MTALPGKSPQRRAEAARKRLSALVRAGDPGTRKGREQAVQEIRTARREIEQAQGELRSRSHEEARRYRQFDDSYKTAKKDAWASSRTTPGRRRRGPSLHGESGAKAFYLVRNALPSPLTYGELKTSRLTEEECDELFDLTHASLRGEVGPTEVERWEHLLEKAADRIGQVAAARLQGF